MDKTTEQEKAKQKRDEFLDNLLTIFEAAAATSVISSTNSVANSVDTDDDDFDFD